jgi:hypothetical protein
MLVEERNRCHIIGEPGQAGGLGLEDAGGVGVQGGDAVDQSLDVGIDGGAARWERCVQLRSTINESGDLRPYEADSFPRNADRAR